jgi:threonyl-tRNA synthetase
MDDLDHRSLGSRLELYHLQDDAPGMVFWHPRGYAVYRVLEDYIRRKMRGLGFAEVRTPQVLPRSLWERSGHWDKFRDNMFLVEDEGGRQMALKPMSCPCHVQIFNKGLRSWRELPIRYAEFGACHRNESSGSMHGLMRTRAFEQDDAHVFCREEDVVAEIGRFIGLLDEVYRELGFADYRVALSTRPAERAGSDAQWDWAEARLEEAARARGMDFVVQPGEGAFYGPKLEFVLRDRLGRSWQCGAMLLEHHGGVLPFWLAPEQVAVAPISDRQGDYARQVLDMLGRSGVRAVLHDGNETLPRRIVAAHDAGIPVMAIVGEREARDGSVALRFRNGVQSVLKLADAAASLSGGYLPP